MRLRTFLTSTVRRLLLAGWVVAVAALTWSMRSVTGVIGLSAIAATGGIALLVIKTVFELHLTIHQQESQRLASEKRVASRFESGDVSVTALRRDLERTDGLIVERVRQVEAERTELKKRLDTVDTTLGRHASRLEGLGSRLAEENLGRRQLTGTADKIIDRVRAVEARTVSLETATSEQGASRSLDVARHASASVDPPDDILLLVALHRSASTRLFDIARTHPNVILEPMAETWSQLGLRGMRYPVALSNTTISRVFIETAPDVGTRVPLMPRFADSSDAAELRWAVEKCHAQFFDFDAQKFHAGLAEFEAGTGRRVTLVFVLRSPIESMWSMVDYQRRDPEWYAFLNPATVPEFIRASLQSMVELAELRPGRVIDYPDMQPDSDRLRGLGSLLFDTTDADERVEAWCRYALGATERSARMTSQSGPFLGEPDRDRSVDGPDGAWTAQTDLIAEAQAAYARILEIADTGLNGT